VGGAIAWNAAGAIDLTDTTGAARASQDVTVIDGEPYFISVKNVGAGNALRLFVDNVSVTSPTGQNNIVAGETRSTEWTASGATLDVSLRNFTDGTTQAADNVSVRKIKTIRELHCTDGRVFAEEDAPDPIPAGAVWRTKGRFYREPQIGLELSGDGRTFGEQVFRSFGALGEYERICRFGPLGGHYRLTAKVTVSEPRDITLDAMANVEVA